MTSINLIILIYLSLTLVKIYISLTLSSLNMGEIHKNSSVPQFIKDWITPEEYEKSRQYSLKKAKMGRISLLWGSLTTLAVIFTGILGKIDHLWGSLELSQLWHGFFYLLTISALFELLSFPIEFHNQFVLEEEFGFNKMGLKLFFSDKIKQGVLSLILGLPLFWGLLLFLRLSGDLWWLYAWGFVFLFQMILFFLYPVVIAPLFNKFTPLEDGELKDRLEDLAKKCGFANQGIFLMDGSKRSAHSNAYFTGFGRFRRIVLFDTLVEQLSIDELEGVLAHEIGHFKKKHILKRLIGSVISMGLGFFLLNLLMNYAPLYSAFGFGNSSLHGLLVILMFCSSPISYLLTPWGASRSRRHEYQADRYSFQVLGDSEPLLGALLKLSQKNLSNMTPHRLFSRFYYSHPTLLERQTALMKLQESDNGTEE